MFPIKDNGFKTTYFTNNCPKLQIKVFTEAATRGILSKKLFLEISQNSQGSTCIKASFLNKVAGMRPVGKHENSCKPADLLK